MILAALAANAAFADLSRDYREMLATLEFAQSAKSALAAVSEAEAADSAKDGVAAVRSARNFTESAKLVRIDIATASPATDMGYFRIDFDRADKFEKLQMLRDEFGIE